MINAIITTLSDPAQTTAIILMILASCACILAWKRYETAWLLYAHLLFLFAPIAYLAFAVNCAMSGITFGSLCANIIASFILYILPPIMILAFIMGYFMIPKIYLRKSRKIKNKVFEKLCRNHLVNAELFALDKAEPTALSFKNKVFVSVGMFELLSKKELEAVILHELHHIKNNAAWKKFSTRYVRLFSPITWFARNDFPEEEKADEFAVKIQKTDKHILSAQRKVNNFI